MKISQTNHQNLQQIYQSQSERTGQGQEASPASASRQPDRKDQVELSSGAQLLQKAAQQVDREDPQRLAHIDHLREQVQNDTYQVPAQLAARLMSQLF
jgi:flagellar biosynthesis anti-sigma factor FlgM